MTAVYVATLDTGGISYSGAVYTGVGATEDEAREAVGQAVLRRERGTHTTYYGETLTTVAAIDDYYGIRVDGPITIGEAVVR